MKSIAALASVVVLTALAVPGMSSGQSSPLPTIDVTVGGGTIAVAGTLQSGASTVSVTNSGEEPASVVLVRLHDGVTAEQFKAALSEIRDVNEVHDYGSIRVDYPVDPGSSTLDTVLPAGSYIALDLADEDPSKSPTASFTIEKAATEASLPDAAATVASIDFAFKVPKSIERGSTVRFEQQGNVAHMIAAARFKNAFVAKRAMRLLRAGKDKKAEKLVKGFALFMEPTSQDAVHQLRVDAAPGTYVLACFLPTQDGRAHTRLGMVRKLKITK